LEDTNGLLAQDLVWILSTGETSARKKESQSGGRDMRIGRRSTATPELKERGTPGNIEFGKTEPGSFLRMDWMGNEGKTKNLKGRLWFAGG